MPFLTALAALRPRRCPIPDDAPAPVAAPKGAGPQITADDDYPRYRGVIIGQLVLQQQLGPLMFSSLGVLLRSMQRDLGFGTIEAGWLGAARTVGQLLVFPASILLVRFSSYRLFNAFAVGLALALLLGGLAPTYAVSVAALAFYSVGMAFGLIPANLVRLQWIPLRELGTIAGASLALQAVFQIAGLAVVPLILDAVRGWRAIFLGNAALLFAISVVWAFTARERITGRSQAASVNDRPLAAASRGLRRREFYLLGLAVLGGGTTFTTFLLLLPSYFVHDRGFWLSASGSITAVIPLGGLVVNLSAGYISDRIGLRKPLIWPAGIILPPLYLVLLSPLPLWVLVPVAALIGGFAFMHFPSLQSIPCGLPDVSPSEVVIGQALMGTIATLGILSGPVIASTVAEYTGSFGYGLMSIILLPVLFVVASVFLPETGRKARLRAP